MAVATTVSRDHLTAFQEVPSLIIAIGSLAPPHVAFLKDHLDYITGHSSQHAAQTRSYAIAILAYDVAPYARYPRQLAQAAMALNHLLTILPASNILIGGDSAGAHLSLDVLAHILHPHPDRSVPEIKPLEGQKLKAAVLISPWVELSTHADSFRRNSWKEAVPTQAPVRWAKEFMGGCPRDPYNAPLTAPQGWWKGLSGILEDLYICGGRDEILIDDIDKFVEIMRAEWEGPGKLKVDMVDGEAHDSLVLDRVFGYAGKDIKMDKVVRDWQEEAVPL